MPFIVGIDLGTTNSAAAFVEPALGAEAPVLDFPVPQLQRPGEVASRSLLPSCLYLAGEHELPSGATRLPWGESGRMIAGEFARWQGARVPGRLVASAKSWLCHSGVDRAAPILPWGAPSEVEKISPVEASARLLAHVADAWKAARPQAPLAEQEVVVTVPASFDEVARALTLKAAHQAGFKNLTLVEEPQAAFYDFTARHRGELSKILSDARLVLVVDVGGGTTDFTLIQTRIASGDVQLRRIAVGDHLMLGGDNMDVALARLCEERLLAGGRRLGAAQWIQLVQGARAAKEFLLDSAGPEKYGIGIIGEGSRLVASSLSTEVSRVETQQLILDGFIPFCAPEEAPRRTARMALQELGLPYAQDAAITRHLAAFLRRHAQDGLAALGRPDSSPALPRPDAVLLNGGVFNSPKLAARLVDVLSSWWPDAPRVPLLPHDSLELAVARGAAAYGLARHGLIHRISGGAAHGLYVGLAADREEVSARAICLIPRGHEEGQAVDLTSRTFELSVGRPVQFPLFSTASGRADHPGDLVPIDEDFHALPPIHTLLSTRANTKAVPVHLRATLTELGTLELWCVSNVNDERWRLEFELRGATPREAGTVVESMPARFEEARRLVEEVFGPKPSRELKRVKQLSRSLEKTIGPREQWGLPLLRELWSTLLAGAKRRRRSAEHERVFYRLIGYSLRPGFGYPLDEWRSGETFKLFGELVQFHGERPVWNEFWILWRRIAGGLDEARQLGLWNYLKPHLARRIPPKQGKQTPRKKGVQPEGLDEMTRTAASLEHLDPVEKTVLGNWIAGRLHHPDLAAGPWIWALGRLGARVPLYGSSHKTVNPSQAAAWLALLLEPGLGARDGAAFAILQLARLTGDRARDLDEAARGRAVNALGSMNAPERWLRMLTEVVEPDANDDAQAMGDTLPLGLKLR